MKIAILGCRGIPNNYSGFEQLAEYLSVGLVNKGHEVTVYNSHNHIYKKSEFRGVEIKHKFDPEYAIGTAGQFIYDLNCIINSRRSGYEIIYQLGYTSSAVWGKILPKKPLIVSNMDGLEWKRSKYSDRVRKFLKLSEKWAINTSDYLISDSIGIKSYLLEEYGAESTYIAYGANNFNDPNEEILSKYNLSPNNYLLAIMRFEPENNVETIIKGYLESKNKKRLILIGNPETKFGKYLQKKYKSEDIKFFGKIFDIKILNNLRYYCSLYFHGHSVGGTNPSLLEAMASRALICAHDNPFNKGVLGEDGIYFKDEHDVSRIIAEQGMSKTGLTLEKLENNSHKIATIFSWKNIISLYENFFLKILEDQNLSVKNKVLVSSSHKKEPLPV